MVSTCNKTILVISLAHEVHVLCILLFTFNALGDTIWELGNLVRKSTCREPDINNNKRDASSTTNDYFKEKAICWLFYKFNQMLDSMWYSVWKMQHLSVIKIVTDIFRF